MTERQYPIHLRRIGEHQIAEYLEGLMEEIDTHEKMFLELCQVKRERDALNADTVPREGYERLLERFLHLLESDFIRSFDEYDRETGTYKRDISEADGVTHVIRCKDCQAWGRSPYGHPTIGWCKIHGSHRNPDYYCADAEPLTEGSDSNVRSALCMPD